MIKKQKTTHKRKPYWLCRVISRYEDDRNGLPRFSANTALYVAMPSIVKSLNELGYHIKKSETRESFGPDPYCSINVDLYGFKSKEIPSNALEKIVGGYRLRIKN
ncbi:hypothetical protein HYT26_01160 [Candidatus Pacearchaeota archaeon]|nr:hypothetical protein [Candidatus Pacearchaeota archaeon]